MDIANVWLQSGLPALIRGGKLSPKAHPRYSNIAWYEEGKQGICYHLIQTGNQRPWILKKFREGMMPERNYLLAIRNLLPNGIAFSPGVKRALLTNKDVKSEDNVYNSPELLRWVEDTILMPKVPGVPWARISQELRKGTYQISREHRLMFAKNLASAVVELEDNGCSHRDLSHQNMILDTQEYVVYLVDWDSLFHGSLSFHRNTIVGTEGYLPSWAMDKNGKLDARKTWNARGDRFSLAILIVELLSIDQNSKSYHEGSLFSQEILANPSHPEITQAISNMRAISEDLSDLLERTLRANSYEECPKPQEWNTVLENVPLSPEDSATKEPEEEISIEPVHDDDEEMGDFTPSKINYFLLFFILALPLIFWGIYRFQNNPNLNNTQLPNPNTPSETSTNLVENILPPKTEVSPNIPSGVPKAGTPREYKMIVEYNDSDLEIFIAGKKIEHTPKNEAIVSIVPGEYFVVLGFSKVIYDPIKKDYKRGPLVRIDNNIRFGPSANQIRISIDREKLTWQATSIP